MLSRKSFSIIDWVEEKFHQLFRDEKKDQVTEKLDEQDKSLTYISKQLSSAPVIAAVIVAPVIERKDSPPMDIPGAQLRKSQARDDEEESFESSPQSVGIYTEKQSSQRIMETFNWWREEKTDRMNNDEVGSVVTNSFSGSYKQPF